MVSGTGAKENIVVTLMDMNGRIVWNSGSTRNYRIAVSTEKFAKGTYIIAVQSGTEKTQTKLVIAR